MTTKSRRDPAIRTLMMGLHPRAGESSALSLLKQGPAADLLRLIREYTAIKYALLGAAQQTRLDDVCLGIAAASQATIETIEVTARTPSFLELAQYDALITFSFHPYHNNERLGDVLAEYVESGRGGVVLGNYAFCTYHTNQQIRGRFLSENMHPLTFSAFEDTRTTPQFHEWAPQEEPTALEDELFQGVKKFSGGKGSIRCTSTESPGSICVASYEDGIPLVAVRRVEVPEEWARLPLTPTSAARERTRSEKSNGRRGSVSSVWSIGEYTSDDEGDEVQASNIEVEELSEDEKAEEAKAEGEAKAAEEARIASASSSASSGETKTSEEKERAPVVHFASEGETKSDGGSPSAPSSSSSSSSSSGSSSSSSSSSGNSAFIPFGNLQPRALSLARSEEKKLLVKGKAENALWVATPLSPSLSEIAFSPREGPPSPLALARNGSNVAITTTTATTTTASATTSATTTPNFIPQPPDRMRRTKTDDKKVLFRGVADNALWVSTPLSPSLSEIAFSPREATGEGPPSPLSLARAGSNTFAGATSTSTTNSATTTPYLSSSATLLPPPFHSLPPGRQGGLFSCGGATSSSSSSSSSIPALDAPAPSGSPTSIVIHLPFASFGSTTSAATTSQPSTTTNGTTSTTHEDASTNTILHNASQHTAEKVKREPVTRNIVGLNFYLPSSRVDDFFWDSRTDGFRLMANALNFASVFKIQSMPQNG